MSTLNLFQVHLNSKENGFTTDAVPDGVKC